MTQTDGMIQQMLKLHNEVRRERNLPPLSLHPKLQKLAQQHAADMQKNKKITHADFGKRIKEAGYPLAPGAGTENVASGGGESGTPEKIFHNWMKSTEGHKENILNKDSQDVGFGSASDGASGQRYWCAVFAKQQG